MYKLYKKTDDRSSNMYGIKSIDESKNPFLNSPCFLTWNANDINEKYINGLCKKALRMARLYTTDEDGAGYVVDDFPVVFLMMEDDKTGLSDERIAEFAEKYFIPLISKYNAKIDIIEAQKNMRNVNILTNCNATYKILEVEEYMLKRMQELGYTQEEMLTVLSQMCVFPFQTQADLSKFKSTTIAFANVNDAEVEIKADIRINKALKERLARNNKKVLNANDSENVELVYTEGTETHKMESYTGKNDIAPYVTTIVSNALKNSIQNNLHKDDFVPISIRSLKNGTEQISLEIQNGKTIEEIVNQLDENLEYEGVTKLSKKELEITAKLMESYKEREKLTQDLVSMNDKKSSLEENLKIILEAVDNNCSEITKKKILLALRYQFADEEIIKAAPSDKDIIEGNIAIEGVENNKYGVAVRPPDYESKTKLPIGTSVEVNMKKIREDEKVRDVRKANLEIREFEKNEQSKESKSH